MIAAPSRKDRVVGCLVGLAVGDALGTTLEFKRPGTFSPLTDMIGGGPFRLEAGQWTDDTSMALCLAESLLEKGGFDPRDQMQRYIKWWRDGHHSCTGRCFDIGISTRGALASFEASGNPFSGSSDPNGAGNGCLMRLAPVPMFFLSEPERALHYCVESARTTHGATMVIFLSIGLIDKVQTALLQGAYTPDTPAAVVYKASWPEEKIVRCTVGSLAESTRAAGITKTALIVVGDFLGTQYERSKLYDPAFTTEFRKGEPV